MDEKKKKYWEEVEAKKLQRRQEEDLLRSRNENKTSFSKLENEIAELKSELRFQFEINSDSFSELHSENTTVHNRIKDLINTYETEINILKKKIVELEKEIEKSSFSKNFILIEKLIRINNTPLSKEEISLDEDLRNLNLSNGLDSDLIFSSLRIELIATFNGYPVVTIEEALEAMCTIKSDFNISLNLKNLSKAVLIFSVINSYDEALSLLKMTCSL